MIIYKSRKYPNVKTQLYFEIDKLKLELIKYDKDSKEYKDINDKLSFVEYRLKRYLDIAEKNTKIRNKLRRQRNNERFKFR